MHFKKHSIFIKLFSIITGTGVIIGLIFIFFLRVHFNENIRKQLNNNVENYLIYLAKEIGTPPDTLKARSIAENYSIAIRYEGSGTAWQYGEFFLYQSERKYHFLKLIMGFWREDPFVVKNKDGSKFLFVPDFHKIVNPNPFEIAILFFLLAVVLSLSYILIRRILRPIKYLTVGVDELSRGNLEHKIPLSGKDELSFLSRSFNEMTRKIKDMIEARDRLLLDVSHELRSPLTRIKLALEFVKDEKKRESIAADVKEIETMITEILESERLKDDNGRLKLCPVNIHVLLHEVLENYKEKRPGITLQDIPENLELIIDKERIKLVFKNILDNAVKYSHSQSRPIIISAEELPDKAIIIIRDDGIGIPDEDLPFIFEPFFRVDKSRTRKTGGYGLGLSLCKNIIEAHNGNISITNNHDRGITVRVELNR